MSTPLDTVLFVAIMLFMVGFYLYMAIEMSTDDWPGFIIVAANITLVLALGILFGAAYLGENSWIGAICIVLIGIYGVCTFGFGLLFLPGMLLSIPISTVRSLLSNKEPLPPLEVRMAQYEKTRKEYK